MHTLPHHLLNHHKGNVELKEMYFAIGLRSFAMSLVSIFVPIYLYKLGFSASSIFLYFAYYFGFSALMTIFSGRISFRIGLKKSIAFSFVFMAVTFLLLLSIQQFSWPLILIAIISAISSNLFWNAYHADFSKIKDTKEDGAEVGKMTAIIRMAGLIAPLFGGIIASYGGMPSTLGVASVLLLCAMIPLFLTKEVIKDREVDFKRIKIKDIKEDLISYSAGSIEYGTYYIVWPLFVFIFLAEYLYVGLVTTLASIATALFILYIGKKVDKSGKSLFIKRGGQLNFFQNFYRIFVETTVGIFSANIFTNIANAVWQVPWMARFYERADKFPRAEYILVMEVASNGIRFFFSILLFALSFFFALKSVLITGLVITAISSLWIGRMK